MKRYIIDENTVESLVREVIREAVGNLDTASGMDGDIRRRRRPSRQRPEPRPVPSGRTAQMRQDWDDMDSRMNDLSSMGRIDGSFEQDARSTDGGWDARDVRAKRDVLDNFINGEAPDKNEEYW